MYSKVNVPKAYISSSKEKENTSCHHRKPGKKHFLTIYSCPYFPQRAAGKPAGKGQIRVFLPGKSLPGSDPGSNLCRLLQKSHEKNIGTEKYRQSNAGHIRQTPLTCYRTGQEHTGEDPCQTAYKT